MSSHDERLAELEKWRRDAEQRAPLVTVVSYVADLLDERSYRTRHTTDRSRFWQRVRIRLVVVGVAVGIVTSTVNAVQSYRYRVPRPAVTYIVDTRTPHTPTVHLPVVKMPSGKTVTP